MSSRRDRGYWISNWRESELPTATKLRVAARNLWLRIAKRQACCGHDGEPGC